MKKKIIIAIAVVFLLLVGATLAAYRFIRIDIVNISGLERQSSEVIEEALFEDNTSRSFLALYLERFFGKKKTITFVEDYDIEFVSAHEIEVTVYEKKIVGYLECMGQNWYFDKDGIVVESMSSELEDVIYVSGLDFEYIVVGEVIPLGNQEIFDMLLELTQLISKYEMDIDRIHLNSDETFKLYIGQVRVEFGDGDMLTEKVIDLKDLLPNLEDVPGVLDMSVYDTGRIGYTFKKDT